jgi:L-ascorbate metabolism protein UlaG (beta-lactamase superfamily)
MTLALVASLLAASVMPSGAGGETAADRISSPAGANVIGRNISTPNETGTEETQAPGIEIRQETIACKREPAGKRDPEERRVAMAREAVEEKPAGKKERTGEKDSARKQSKSKKEAPAQGTPGAKKTKAAGKGTVDIEWYGHACFMIKTLGGASIVIDPFDDEKFPYSLPEGPVALAFASHDHFDHNNVSAVEPEIAVKGGEAGAMVTDPLRTIPPYGTYTFGDDSTSYVLQVVPSYHDEEKGAKRGHNTISVWDIDGVRIVHLGDLGCALDEKQVEAIGRPDVLMIPVGGYYTIDAGGARAIVERLSPRIVLPMHYKTKILGDKLPISGVEEFLKGWKSVTDAEGCVLKLTPGELPEGPEIVLLKYHGRGEEE